MRNGGKLYEAIVQETLEYRVVVEAESPPLAGDKAIDAVREMGSEWATVVDRQICTVHEKAWAKGEGDDA